MLMSALTSAFKRSMNLLTCIYKHMKQSTFLQKKRKITSFSHFLNSFIMDLHVNQPHVVLFPFMAQGHMIPMVDIARLLAQRGVMVSIVTTPLNAARFKPVLARAVDSGLPIKIYQIQFPCEKAGLPKGYEHFELLTNMDEILGFFNAGTLLRDEAEELFEKLSPRPCCVISDFCLPYAAKIASKFHVPRISFHGMCCFCLLCMYKIRKSGILDRVTSESEYFIIPGLPDRVEITKAQFPLGILSRNDLWKDIMDQIVEADLNSYGVVVNTFEELEPAYVKEYKKVRADKVWCIGPVSLCNKERMDKVERGSKASIDEQQCLKWLDSWEPSSVLYVCMGSLCNLPPKQMIELGLGLETSGRPFIWVIRGAEKFKTLVEWISESGFEERIKGRGMLIRGWAPQVIILSHPAVGGFLTHCGWNSTIEGITAGLPMLTWPLFGDQFCNEKLVVQVLKIAVSIGVKDPRILGEEEKRVGVAAYKEDVKRAIDCLFMEGEEGEKRRERAKELHKLARRAMEEGGSSYLNLTTLINDIMQQSCNGHLS